MFSFNVDFMKPSVDNNTHWQQPLSDSCTKAFITFVNQSSFRTFKVIKLLSI